MREEKVRILLGNRSFTRFAEEIYQMINLEAKRNRMLLKGIKEIEQEIIEGRAFLGSQFVGYISLFPWQELRLVELASLVVKEPYRRQGIGAKLGQNIYGLAGKLFPQFKIIALANQDSKSIFQKEGLTFLPKCCLPQELWGVCPRCKDYGSLPACHCVGMVESKRNKGYTIEPLTVDSPYLSRTAELYCQIWQEPPWNENFWTREGVMCDIQGELIKENAFGYVAVNHSQVASFTWGYQVSKERMAEICGSNQLDMFFTNHSKVFYIDELGTDKALRKHRLGRELSWRLLSTIESEGFSLALLRTDIQAFAARALYSKLGFKELSVLDEKHQDRSYWVLDLKH